MDTKFPKTLRLLYYIAAAGFFGVIIFGVLFASRTPTIEDSPVIAERRIARNEIFYTQVLYYIAWTVSGMLEQGNR